MYHDADVGMIHAVATSRGDHTPGYSGKSLVDKLGFKPGMTVATVGPHGRYTDIVWPVPEGVKIVSRVPASPAVVHLFATKRSDLVRHLKSLRPKLVQDGMIWVSWPKKSSGVATDITENTIREVCLRRETLRGSESGTIALLLEELRNPPDPSHKGGEELAFKSERFAPLEEIEIGETAEVEAGVLV